MYGPNMDANRHGVASLTIARGTVRSYIKERVLIHSRDLKKLVDFPRLSPP